LSAATAKTCCCGTSRATCIGIPTTCSKMGRGGDLETRRQGDSQRQFSFSRSLPLLVSPLLISPLSASYHDLVLLAALGLQPANDGIF
jgi:hypothetical protein